MKLLSSVELETSESVDINLSPLIDMVFLLLIFFMVTTVFVKQTGIDIEKPTATTARALEENTVMLTVSSAGVITYEDSRVDPDAVQGLVARLLRHRNVPVVILADRSADTGVVVHIIDQCKLAGAETVSIAAEEQAADAR